MDCAGANLAPTLCPSAASSSSLPVLSSLLSFCNRSKNDVCSSSSRRGVEGTPSVLFAEVLGVIVRTASRAPQRTFWPVLGVFWSRKIDRNMDLNRADGAGVLGESIPLIAVVFQLHLKNTEDAMHVQATVLGASGSRRWC